MFWPEHVFELPAFCAERCDRGYYGQDCLQSCDCNGNPCDAISGACKCGPGYLGSRCEQVSFSLQSWKSFFDFVCLSVCVCLSPFSALPFFLCFFFYKTIELKAIINQRPENQFEIKQQNVNFQIQELNKLRTIFKEMEKSESHFQIKDLLSIFQT